MTARPFVRAGILIFPLVAASLTPGCKNQQSTSTANRTEPALHAPAPVAVRPTTAPAVAQTDAAEAATTPLSDTLAQKTAEYARNLEPAMTATPPKHRAPAGSPPEPSSVQWDQPPHANAHDPAPTRATPPAAANTGATLPPTDAAPAKPQSSPKAEAQTAGAIVASASDSKHAASVARAAKSNSLNDIPAIVPESSDFGDGTASAAASDPLGQRLAKRARDNPRDLAAQLDVELYGMLRDDPAPQLASLASLPNEDKEVVAALVDGISNFRTGVRQDANMLLSQKIRPLTEMADRLAAQAELAVPVVALCKRVDGFGKYEPIDPPRFPAGRENPVIVYCEIKNFESRMNDKRLWETKLTQHVDLYTEGGMLVWQDKRRPVSDECRNRRHDFFLYNVVKLPANLTIGRYLIKVSIEDLTANRVAESTVPVEIVGQ